MATHSSILAREIPWTEESGRQQSIRLLKSHTRLKRHSMHAVVESKLKLFVEFDTIKENCCKLKIYLWKGTEGKKANHLRGELGQNEVNTHVCFGAEGESVRK